MSKKLNVKYFIQDTSSNWASENPKMSEGVIAYETDTNKIKLFDGEHSFSELSYVGGEGSSGGATDYSALTGKPRINSVELSGNKSLDDLGIQAKGEYATKAQGTKADTAVQPSDLSAYATTETMNSALANKADTSALAGKANKSTTLSGYGITDAYTKTEADGKYATKAQGTKADTAVQPSALSDYVTTETATSTYATKASLSGYATTSALDGKANKSTTLNGYGITDAYTKTEADGKYALKTAIPSGDKIMTGTKAGATVSKPAGEEVADVKTSLEALIDALSARGIITIA